MDLRKGKAKIGAIFIIIVMALCLGQIHVSAKQKTVKVGWPIQKGLSEVDDQGDYSGYTYDYLKEIAQFTGWEYEFIEVEGDINAQLNTLLEMLQKGEIDLMGAMRYNEAMGEMFDYPSDSYGKFYQVLAMRSDNDEIDEYNFTKQKNLKITVVKDSPTQRTKLEQYAEITGLSYEFIECDSAIETFEKVQKKEADLVLSTDVNVAEGMRSLVKFGGSGFYFATTKGNKALVSELNQAILNIQDTYPTLESDLYEQYFVQDDIFVMTADEKEYVTEHPELRVLYIDDIAPLSYT